MATKGEPEVKNSFGLLSKHIVMANATRLKSLHAFTGRSQSLHLGPGAGHVRLDDKAMANISQ